MKEELRKSLTDLIDETLLELEELKKSRYAAEEIELKGPGEGIAGKPSNGDLHAKAEDKKKDDDDEDDKDKKDKEDAMKAEGQNRQSDPDGGKHKPAAGEGMERGQGPSASPQSGKSHGQGKNAEADPGDTHHEDAAKAEDKKKDEKEPHEDDDKHEEKEKKMAKKLLDMHKGDSPEKVDKDMRAAGMRKSDEEFESLMKSFVEERVKPLEDKLSTILDLVNKIAEQPVPPKGATANVVPLQKSADGFSGESLSKAELASKLFELKKSGAKVDSLDITRAEMGQDLYKIAQKYKIS